MPTESRQIIFTDDEVIIAIQQLYQRSNQSLPKGRIENVVVHGEDGCSVDYDVIEESNFRDHVKVGSEKLAAALILFCKTRKIPIPATAKKKLSVANNQLALWITIGAAGETQDAPVRKAAG